LNKRLHPEDLALVREWSASLAECGMAPSSIERLCKRMRGFLGVTHNGLLAATPADLAAFAATKAAHLKGGIPEPLRMGILLRGRSLRETVQALRTFYTWAAERALVDPNRTPVTGLRLPPPAPRRGVLILRDGPAYDRLLHTPSKADDVAIVWCLAHGLRVEDVVRLRVEDVDLDRRELWLSNRVMPLTPRGAEALRPIIELRQHFAAGGLVFATTRGRRLRPEHVHRALRRLAEQAQVRRRTRVTVAGFRQLFLARAMRRGVAADVLPALLGIPLPRPLGPHTTPRQDRVHRELRRVTHRWSRWIG
jgi:integrase